MSQKTVALSPATYSRLLAARAGLEVAVQRSPHLYPSWMQKGRISLDDAVSFFLDHREGDTARKAKHDAKRRKKNEPTHLDSLDPIEEDQIVTIHNG